MMPALRACIFVGPSLDPSSLALSPALSALQWLPPARRGDIPRVLEEGYQIIGLIDGEFQQHCAPSPKEMLVALKAKVTLIGGGSMGALRAAEAMPYGMIGIGAIYKWYQSGRLSRDDDVAVAYYVHQQRYVLTNVPMVNVLWTVDRARRKEVWSTSTRRSIVKAARQFHWTDRTWDAIGERVGLPDLGNHPLVRDPQSDLKGLDALAVVQEVLRRLTCQ